jgi:hypothetical protein
MSLPLILPEVDEGKIYPKMSDLIRNNNFTFDVKEEICLFDLQKLIPNYKMVEIARCVLNIKENFPNSKRQFMEGKTFDKKIIDYIPNDLFIQDWKSNESQWVYCIAYGDYVVKIGMTATGMAQRFGSYNTGTKKAMIKGSCATTNFVITQCNYLAILNGMDVRIYAYKIPTEKIEVSIFGETHFVMPKIAYKYEEVLIQKVVDTIGRQPILCGFVDNEKE